MGSGWILPNERPKVCGEAPFGSVGQPSASQPRQPSEPSPAQNGPVNLLGVWRFGRKEERKKERNEERKKGRLEEGGRLYTLESSGSTDYWQIGLKNIFEITFVVELPLRLLSSLVEDYV